MTVVTTFLILCSLFKKITRLKHEPQSMLSILEKITVAHPESGFTHCSVNFSLEDRVSWCSHYSHVDGRVVDSSYHIRKQQPKYYLNEPQNINGPKTSSVLFLREISYIKKEKLIKNTGPNELKFLISNLVQYITVHKGLVL